MSKIIAGINLTIDGFCDHTAFEPDGEVHDHYTQLLRDSSMVLYGNTTFQLMKFWQELLESPSGEKHMNDFAQAIDQVPKTVFSKQLKDSSELAWVTASLATKTLEETVLDLKRKPGKDVLVGSRSLIVQLTNLDLIDEFQLFVHPVILGKGLPLFDELQNRTLLKLEKSKTFSSGSILSYYIKA